MSLEDVGREPPAWQVGAGIGWDVRPNWTVALDYRRFNAESPNPGTDPAKNADGLDSVHELFAAMHLTF